MADITNSIAGRNTATVDISIYSDTIVTKDWSLAVDTTCNAWAYDASFIRLDKVIDFDIGWDVNRRR
jgi:hypothetical protein